LAVVAAPAQAQVTVNSSCDEIKKLSHADFLWANYRDNLNDADERAGKVNGGWYVTTRWYFCTRGQGGWSDEQWQDECTSKGWSRAGGFITMSNRGAYNFPSPQTDLNTTEFCALHNTNPGRYGLYFDGKGWAYSQYVCHQDRNGDGTYETRAVGAPNCNQQGGSPTYKPKWVDPRQGGDR